MRAILMLLIIKYYTLIIRKINILSFVLPYTTYNLFDELFYKCCQINLGGKSWKRAKFYKITLNLLPLK